MCAQFFNKNTIMTVPDPYGIKYVFPSDLDSDGDLDLLYINSSSKYINWQKNNGSQTFTDYGIDTLTTGEPKSLYAIDVDKDGDIDVLSASANDNTISSFTTSTGEK